MSEIINIACCISIDANIAFDILTLPLTAQASSMRAESCLGQTTIVPEILMLYVAYWHFLYVQIVCVRYGVFEV